MLTEKQARVHITVAGRAKREEIDRALLSEDDNV